MMEMLESDLGFEKIHEIHCTDDSRPWWKGYIAEAKVWVCGDVFRVETAGSILRNGNWVERERVRSWR